MHRIAKKGLEIDRVGTSARTCNFLHGGYMYKVLSTQPLFIHNGMTNNVFLIPGPPPYPGSACRLLCLSKLSIRTGGGRGSQ